MIILREIVIIPNKKDYIQQVVTQLKKDILWEKSPFHIKIKQSLCAPNKTASNYEVKN